MCAARIELIKLAKPLVSAYCSLLTLLTVLSELIGPECSFPCKELGVFCVRNGPHPPLSHVTVRCGFDFFPFFNSPQYGDLLIDVAQQDIACIRYIE